jgi:L-ascorbate metabolism protein UlaG (beta-lactamase superfamily)
LKQEKDEMRPRALVVAVLFVSLIGAPTSRAQQHAAATDSSPVWNDNSLIRIQKSGGDPTRYGNVKIEFYGHNAFKITSPIGLTILTDPWRNDTTGHYPNWFLHEFPALRVDIVLSTHAHFDHDAVERPNGLVVLERLVGDFKFGDIKVTGLADKHQCEPAPADKADRPSADSRVETCPPDNVLGFDNAIQIIETGGMRIVIWGDNRAVPDPSLDHYLRNAEVFILPIETILTPSEVDSIIQKYDPKAIIPAHYFLVGLTADVAQLASADEWVNAQEKLRHADVRRLNSGNLTLAAAELKRSHHRIYYFDDHFERN